MKNEFNWQCIGNPIEEGLYLVSILKNGRSYVDVDYFSVAYGEWEHYKESESVIGWYSIHELTPSPLRKLNAENLIDVLKEIISYLENDDNHADFSTYLQQLANTSLFHDAIGKVVEMTDGNVLVAEEF